MPLSVTDRGEKAAIVGRIAVVATRTEPQRRAGEIRLTLTVRIANVGRGIDHVAAIERVRRALWRTETRNAKEAPVETKSSRRTWCKCVARE